jgi:hypothetical protein
MKSRRSCDTHRPTSAALLLGAVLALGMAGCGGGGSPTVGGDPAPVPGGAPAPGTPADPTAPDPVAPPPPVAADCQPGIVTGFTGIAGTDALTRVILGEGDGGGGGVGAGGGGADGVGVGGSLGQFRNVDATVEFADGTRFGPVRVDTTNGMVTLVPCGLQPPVLVTFAGAPGSGARYFDEGANVEVPFEGEVLRSVLSRFDRNGGVTPLTDALVSDVTGLFPTSGLASSGPDNRVRAKAVDSWKDPAAVEASHNRVRAAINDQLPRIYRLQDLRRLPVALNAARLASGSQALPDNQNGIYGAVLGGLAITAAATQANPQRPGLAAQKQLSADLADGVLDRRAGDRSLVAVGEGAYNYDTFSRQLTTATGDVTRRAGAGDLASRAIPIQQVRARAGIDPNAALEWLFSLRSDGRLAISGPPGAAAPPVDAALRFARIDLLERAARTRASDPADSWQNCLVATVADGSRLIAWRVGLPGGFATRPAPAGQSWLSVAPESLSAEILGGDNLLFVSRVGLATELSGDSNGKGLCDDVDPHPGAPGVIPAKPVVQVLQDFGNRYLLNSDGTVEGWGLNRRALGVNDLASGSLGSSSRSPVLTAAGVALNSVVMLSRGEDLYRPRALVRSSTQPALDGAVFTWADDAALRFAKRIEGLPKVCWISGPYAVGCDGSLWYAAQVVNGTGVPLPAPQVRKIGDGFWRVNESTRTWEQSTTTGTVLNRIVNYRAVATDDRVYRLNGTEAPVLDTQPEQTPTAPPQVQVPGTVGIAPNR